MICNGEPFILSFQSSTPNATASLEVFFESLMIQWSCLREICENTLFLVKKLFSEGRLFVTNHELVAKFSCSVTEHCMIGERSECSSTKLSSDNFYTRPTSDSDSTSPSAASCVEGEDGNVNEDSISYYEWAPCEDNKLQKLLFKTSVDESIHLLNSTVKTLKRHIHVNFCHDVETTSLKMRINITRCYNEKHHGKGPMDNIRGTLKNCVYHDVMSGKCVIDTPKQFAEHAD